MHNTRIRTSGFWTPGSVVQPAEMEALDAAQYLAIHEGGGTWALSSNVLVGGAAGTSWRFTLPLVADDLAGHVKSGKALAIDAGGALNVSGTVDFLFGSVGKVEAGATLRVLGVALPVPTSGVVSFEGLSKLNMLSGSAARWYAGSLAYLYGEMRLATDPATPGTPGTISVLPGGLIEVKASGGAFGILQVDTGALLGLSGTMVVSDLGQPSPAGTIQIGNIFGPGHIVIDSLSDLKVVGGFVDIYGTNGTVYWHGGAKGHWSGASTTLNVDTGARAIIDGTGTTFTIRDGAVGSLNAATFEVITGATFNFRTTAGAEFFSGSSLFIDAGCSFKQRADNDRTGADIPRGDDAYSGMRPWKSGPNANTGGIGWVIVDLTSAEVWRIPTLAALTAWKLSAPTGNTPMIRYIRSDDCSAQGSDLYILDNHGVQIATMAAVGTGGSKDGTLVLFFTGSSWVNMLAFGQHYHTDVW